MITTNASNRLLKPLSYKHEVVVGYQAFLDLQAKWNELLERSYSGHHIFLTHDWIKTWLDASEPRYTPVIILVYDGPKLIGLAPLCRGSSKRLGPLWRTLSFIADPLNGYYDFMIDKTQNSTEISTYILQILRDLAKHYAVVRLRNLPSHTASLTMSTLEKATVTRMPSPTVDTSRLCFQDYERKILTKKMRYALKRARKVGPITYGLITDESLLDELLQQFFLMHTQRWSKKGPGSIIYTPHHQQFLRTLAHKLMQQSKLHLAYISIDGTLAACTYGFHDQGHLYCYIKSFNPDCSRLSPGTLMVYFLITQEYHHYRTINFMHGAHEYKTHWANDEIVATTVTRFRTPVHRMAHNHIQH